MPVEIVAGDEAKAYDVIGAGMRGKKDRKMISEQKKASSTVAAHVRGRNSRKKADSQGKSAAAIQARIRGKNQRSNKRTRYYTPKEVAMHDRADDLWVSFFHKARSRPPLWRADPSAPPACAPPPRATRPAGRRLTACHRCTT